MDPRAEGRVMPAARDRQASGRHGQRQGSQQPGERNGTGGGGIGYNSGMRRRSLLRLPLALVPPLGLLAPAVRAQPRAPASSMQLAGRQAVALANAGRWPEAMAMAE